MPKGLAIHTCHYNEPGLKVMSVALPGDEFETTTDQLAHLVGAGAASPVAGDDTAAESAPKRGGRPSKADKAAAEAAEKEAADKATADGSAQDEVLG